MKSFAGLMLVALAICGTSCATKRMSDRDQALQKQQRGVDLKRGELAQIAGQYVGDFNSSDGTSHRIRLILEVKDVPESAGGTDPVLIPRLLGSFRFILGDEELGENIDAPVVSSEYIKAKKQLSLVVRHAQFGELILSTIVGRDEITGSWNAPSLSKTGVIKVLKEIPEEL